MNVLRTSQNNIIDNSQVALIQAHVQPTQKPHISPYLSFLNTKINTHIPNNRDPTTIYTQSNAINYKTNVWP